MKYERRSLKGYRAKILRPKPMTSGKDRGKAKDIVRDIARYWNFKILKGLACNKYEKKKSFAKEELLNHAIELFQIIRVDRDRREKFGIRLA